jgi:hypothetical protein
MQEHLASFPDDHLLPKPRLEATRDQSADDPQPPAYGQATQPTRNTCAKCELAVSSIS